MYIKNDLKKQKNMEIKNMERENIGIILCLHYIGEKEGIRCLSVENFRILINKYSFLFSSIDNLDKGGLFLTFDDGYYNQYEYRFRYLKNQNIPSIIFVPVEYINKENFMSAEMMKEVANTKGYFIGGHSFYHRPIKYFSRFGVRFQMKETKKIIGSIIGKDCEYFAFPFGGIPHTTKYSRKYGKKAGYKYVFSTIRTPFSKEDVMNINYIPRIAVTNDNFNEVINLIDNFIKSGDLNEKYNKEVKKNSI